MNIVYLQLIFQTTKLYKFIVDDITGWDGKKDVCLQNNGDSTFSVKAENISLVEFPGNKYLGFVQEEEKANAENVTKKMVDFVKERYNTTLTYFSMSDIDTRFYHLHNSDSKEYLSSNH